MQLLPTIYFVWNNIATQYLPIRVRVFPNPKSGMKIFPVEDELTIKKFLKKCHVLDEINKELDMGLCGDPVFFVNYKDGNGKSKGGSRLDLFDHSNITLKELLPGITRDSNFDMIIRFECCPDRHQTDGTELQRLIDKLSNPDSVLPNSQLFISYASYNVTDDMAKNVKQQLPPIDQISADRPLTIVLIDPAFGNRRGAESPLQVHQWFGLLPRESGFRHIAHFGGERQIPHIFERAEYAPPYDNKEFIKPIFDQYDQLLPRSMSVYLVPLYCQLLIPDRHHAAISITECNRGKYGKEMSITLLPNPLATNENLAKILITDFEGSAQAVHELDHREKYLEYKHKYLNLKYHLLK